MARPVPHRPAIQARDPDFLTGHLVRTLLPWSPVGADVMAQSPLLAESNRDVLWRWVEKILRQADRLCASASC